MRSDEPDNQAMNNDEPIFNPGTRYMIEVRGCVDVEWLRSFDEAARVRIDETGQAEEIRVLVVQTDQSGIVGLVRKLHGLGMTILRVQVVLEGDDCA